MSGMDTCPTNQVLARFLLGQPTGGAAADLERHLRGCDHCLRALVAMRQAEDPAVEALHARATAASGPERDAALGVLLTRLKVRPSAARPGPANLPSAPRAKASPPAQSAPGTPAADSCPDSDADRRLKQLCSFLSPPLAPGELGRLGPYRVLEVLGVGGMGVVFRAEDLQLKRQLALKALLPSVAFSGEARRRFLREAQAAAAIDSEHAVPIYHVGEDGGIPFLTMPVLKGQTLAAWLGGGGRLTVPQVVRLGREVAEGLAAAHERDLVHRDIKPANIFLEGVKSEESAKRGRELPPGLATPPVPRPLTPFKVKILDFGLARTVDDGQHLTQTGTVAGTPAYMAPEQARGEKVDHRCDLFSLGCVLYQLCTGELPFKGPTAMAILTALAVDRPRPVAVLNPDVPQELAGLVMELLAKEPAARPPSARDVVERLQAVERTLAGQPAPAAAGIALPAVVTAGQSDTPARTLPGPTADPTPQLVKPAGRIRAATTAIPRVRRALAAPRSRRWLLAALAAGCLLTLVCTGIWFVGRPPHPATGPGPAAQLPPESTRGPGPPAVPRPKKPVKVFLLAGQNDMAGKAHVRTLDWLDRDPKTAGLLKRLKDPDGSWAVRNDVWIYYRLPNGPRTGYLTVGYGEGVEEFGPELLFGHVLGDHFDNQVLLIKITQGPMSLYREARPPSSGQAGPFYRLMIDTVRHVLAHLKAQFPEYEDQGFELAGFVWFQGWNDMVDRERQAQPEYESNLVNLIKDLRLELGGPNLPVIVGNLGVYGSRATPDVVAFRRSQAAAVNRPEFRGNVALVDTTRYWDREAEDILKKGFRAGKWTDMETQRQFELRATTLEFLYLGSAKTVALTGQGFGEAMKELCTAQTGARVDRTGAPRSPDEVVRSRPDGSP